MNIKKMIILVSAVCLAVGAHAASVSWNIKNVKDSTGATALSTGSVYVFVVQAATADTSWVAGLANKGVDAVSLKMADAAFSYTGPTGAAGDFSYVAANGVTPRTNGEMGMAGSTQYTLYAVVFDSETITDDSKFFVTTAIKNTTYADSVNNTRLWSLGATGSATPSSWNAVADVPEPTSGLLLLVGGALLALRRKQK